MTKHSVRLNAKGLLTAIQKRMVELGLRKESDYINKENKEMFKVKILTAEGEQKWNGRFTDSIYADAAAKDLASSPSWENHYVIVEDISSGREISRYKNLTRRVDEKGNTHYEYPSAIYLLTKNDYETCIDAQSGCNCTGLINSINGMRDRLWNTARSHNKGTEWVNAHPIMQLFAYQLSHISHNREPIEWDGFSNAYLFCQTVRDGLTPPEFDYTLMKDGNLIK
jgi:hypothetical protein